jgi:hypothetical protein
MTVDNFDGRGNGTIYVSATDFGPSSTTLLVSESTSGGTPWQPQQVLADGAVQGSNVVVARNHKAYGFWWDGNQATERIMMKQSDNKGVFGPASTTVATSSDSASSGRSTTTP